MRQRLTEEEKKANKSAANKKWNKANKANKSAANKKWNKANQEQRAAQIKIYREANKNKEAAQNKKWNEANKENRAARGKAYKSANKEKIAAQQKTYREGNKEKIAAYSKEYHKANRRENAAAYLKAYNKNRRENDPLFRLIGNLRRNVTRYLKEGKGKQTQAILGMSFKDFELYLEIDYTDGTHLDHVVPVSWATTDDEVYALNHFSNFQILSADENMDKGNRFVKEENLERTLEFHNNPELLSKIIGRNLDKIT